MSKPSGILEMNPEQYREIDGVVFDLDSFAKHCRPPEEPSQSKAKEPIPSPAGILAMDPENYREIDGVAMDADSYERHSQPPAGEESPPPAQKQPPSRWAFSQLTRIRTAGILRRTASLRCRSWAAPCRRSKSWRMAHVWSP